MAQVNINTTPTHSVEVLIVNSSVRKYMRKSMYFTHSTSLIKNQGLTLIELILYMSIFCMIFLTVMSSVFYIQKIIQTSNQNYYVKNEMYKNLDILQQYLYSSHITVEGDALTFFDKQDNPVLIQTMTDGYIQNKYINKTIHPIEQITFQTYRLELQHSGRILQVQVSWLDGQGKTRDLTEYLIVINQNL